MLSDHALPPNGDPEAFPGRGNGVPKDPNEAVRLMRAAAAQQGEPNAQKFLRTNKISW